MRTLSCPHPLLIVLPVLVGCATVTGERPSVPPQVRTITSIGDRPRPVKTGEPGMTVAADEERPHTPPAPDRVIKGRVVDERGEPVADATVRLAVNGTEAGRAHVVTTDEAGRFTLENLRSGSEYTLIAEQEDDDGHLASGRATTTAPGSRVLIVLASEPTAGRIRVGGVSHSREPDEGPGPVAPRTTVNDEDLPPHESASPAPTPSMSGERVIPQDPSTRDGLATGWRRGDAPVSPTLAPERSDPGPIFTPASPSELLPDPDASRPAPHATAPVSPAPAAPEFPPAPEPDPGPAAGTSAPAPPSQGAPGGKPASSASSALIDAALATTPDPTAAPAASSTTEPVSQPIASPVIPSEPAVPPPDATGSPPSLPVPARPASLPEPAEQPLPQPESPPELPAPPLSNAQPEPDFPESPAGEQATEEPAAPEPAPTTDLGPPPVSPAVESAPPPDPMPTAAGTENDFAPPDPPSVEPPPSRQASPDQPEPQPTSEASARRRMTWGEMVSLATEADPAPTPAASPLRRRTTTASLTTTPAPAPAARVPFTPSCDFDTKRGQLRDFVLVDLQGRPVRFQDLDADLVLLDFWGTWCRPCINAVPHLVELQKRFDSGRLKVVGIAYEQTPMNRAVATVGTTAQRLGINYTVLLGGSDGRPCPVQAAFRVQAFPTLILLDRNGRVLWRDQGGNPATFSRLDRVLAAHLATEFARQ